MRNILLTVCFIFTLSASYSQKKNIPGSNPILTNKFTADPATIVHNDTVYLYVGHDEAKGDEMFNMNQWLCYSSVDMKNWTYHGPIMKATDFKWASRDAWAAQVVEKEGKFYFYTTVEHGHPHYSKAIGVAVADNPKGPFTDARGSALITNDMTPWPHGWDDIDPTIFIDDDGTPWLVWGNLYCYIVKLKSNMTEIEGPIQRIHVPNYTEGPWMHKHNGTYYLSYAAFAHQGFQEKVCYATSKNITGPWTYQGILTENAENSFTIHPAIMEFNDQWYFFYHNGVLELPDGQTGGLGRRSVCVEYLYYNEDGTIQPIIQTTEGISSPPNSKYYTLAQSAEVKKTADQKNIIPIQNIQSGIIHWPGEPFIRTVENPAKNLSFPIGFQYKEGASNIGQTFRVKEDYILEQLSIYAGDGMGTNEETPVSIALYDLGILDSINVRTYESSNNMLGVTDDLQFSYEPQAPGLINIAITFPNQILLKAGHVYVFELQGVKGTAPIYLTRSFTDVYAEGNAYYGREIMSDADKTYDFGIALYGKKGIGK